MTKKHIGSIFLMLLATFIWGTSFVAQTDSAKYIGPLGFMAARSYIGSFMLLLVILVRKRFQKKQNTDVKSNTDLKKLIILGSVCGLALALATGLQQWGIYYNSTVLGIDASGKAGFITAMYIIFVPIFGFFVNRKSGASILIGSILGLIGMYMLCVKDGFTVSLGDILLIGCALAFTIHILVIDKFCKDIDPIVLSFIQFLVAGIILTPIALLTEGNIQISLGRVIFSILYLGIFSSAIAYTIQIYIQKSLHPAVASLIMSFESVFAAISAALLLGERMKPNEILACCIIFLGIIIAEFGEYILKFLKLRK